jgi:ABC-type nitrate/sulfonate/bicarbonate transport system permease component
MTVTTPQRTDGAQNDPDVREGGKRKRRLGMDRSLRYALSVKLLTGLAILAFWEVVVRAVAPSYVARPSGVIPAIPEVVIDPVFIRSVSGTLLPVVEGLFIAVVLGVLIGLAMGQIQWVGWGLKLYTNALFAMPMVAVVPLITMWLGYTDTARLAIIIFAAYFPMAINVYDGSRSVPRRYLEVAESLQASRRSVWFEIVLPASLPYVLAGFRLAAGRALIAAVVAEYLISIDGLGFYILRNAQAFQHNEAFVAVLTLALVGVVSLLFARLATQRFCTWYGKGG